ncbi:PqqD family protein [Candidatus Collierbacteria bacterium]|nr:PqqD family protein [Candidatus Collierbacteria bacterium]
MKINFKTVIRQNSNVVSHKFRNKVYLLDPKSNEVRILNESAGLIWEAFEKPKKVSQAVKALAEFYNLPGKNVKNDAFEFIREYFKLKLLNVVKQSLTPPSQF